MSIKYTNAQRLALAIKRDAALVAERSAMTDADIADLFLDSVVGDTITLTSGRSLPWAEFTAAFRAGDILNAHRDIIARNGATH